MKTKLGAMLDGQGKHLSFHTPGHKRAGRDITELSYSDCLYSPSGVLKEVQEDVAKILGAERSFLLTDGSTSGIFSMIYALKALGGHSLALPRFSHPSVYHACETMGLSIVPVEREIACGIPRPPALAEISRALEGADALLLTSPDYYGFLPDLSGARALCRGKPLLVDGAHGSHLHFTPAYAGRFADLWVDGVHKSLPAMTQGAVVSARDAQFGAALSEGVKRFRTTSPSYPVMESVEYAVKYPRNQEIERASEAFKREHGCLVNDDWTKILYPVGKDGGSALRALEAQGIYPEFYDGNYLLFYLSPCTRKRDLKKLSRALSKIPRAEVGQGERGSIPMYSEDA